ncbi:hypothetical protein ES332_D01G156200v1 [Gossypium tomentosum]|uniref:HMA domain-containing protein n=1 Tax=Gossypium tomentosum TaxID=34277 RepID=A0A5D2M9G9_GOSTO|nr:hypothetical protein ES332_D01G156200v1 [Gossypium tomentosum]
MSQTVVLKVGMSCEGCVGAVKRVLGKMEGFLSCVSLLTEIWMLPLRKLMGIH